jgi:hypothetical protein
MAPGHGLQTREGRVKTLRFHAIIVRTVAECRLIAWQQESRRQHHRESYLPPERRLSFSAADPDNRREE